MAAVIAVLEAVYHAHHCHAAIAAELLNPWQWALLTSELLNSRGQCGLCVSETACLRIKGHRVEW
jgi:hypothetical protein